MTDYGDATPWATIEMFEIRTSLMGKESSRPVADEYLRSAHAEIVQLLYDDFGIDPTSISSSTSGYVLLQRAEADVASGLWEEDTDLNREIPRIENRPYRSVRYYRGIEAVKKWAQNYLETSSPNARVYRTKNTVSSRRDYITDHYG